MTVIYPNHPTLAQQNQLLPPPVPSRTIFEDLANQVFDNLQEGRATVRFFIDQIKDLTEECQKTKDREVGKTLKIATRCLNIINAKLDVGNETQKAIIGPYQEEIALASLAALECLTTLPKEKQQREPLAVVKKAEKEPEPAAPKKTDEQPDDKEMQKAYQNRDDSALLTFIEKGASLKMLSPEDKVRLAQKAIDTLNDSALAALIRGGLPLYDKNGQSPLVLDAVSNNLIESVRAFIEQHANIHTTDAQKNTALHRAFFLGNPEMAQLLMKHIDPLRENAFSQTPLMAILQPHQETFDYFQLTEASVPFFLEELFKKRPEEIRPEDTRPSFAKDILFKLSEGKLPHFPVDMVEMAYLFNKEELTEAVVRETDSEIFFKACEALQNRYPEDSIGRFTITPYTLVPDHLSMGGEAAPILPLGHKNPPLTKLLDILNTLNFRNPHAPYYVNPVEWWNKFSGTNEILTPEEAISKIRNVFSVGIDRIARRIPYTAVPPVEPARSIWFERMELRLKHIINALEEKKNPITTYNILKSLLEGFSLCATRLTTAVVGSHEFLCFNIDTKDPYTAFFRLLAKFRQQCFDDAVNLIHDGEIHRSNKAFVQLGQELGLPGHEDGQTYQEPGNYDGRPDEVRAEFFRRYTPNSILNDWFLQALRSNTDDILSVYLSLQGLFMNSNWNAERYTPILNQLKTIEGTPNPKSRKDMTDELLGKHEIVRSRADQPAKEAIEEDRAGDYRGRFIYDDQFRFRPQAAIYLLNCLGVLKPR